MKAQNPQISIILCLLLMVQCKTSAQNIHVEHSNKTLSESITYFYNSDLNDNILSDLGNVDGRLNYQMKYMLDTIIKKNYQKNDTDIKYCILRFTEFSRRAEAYFIDRDDTTKYILIPKLESDSTSAKELKHGIYKMGEEIKNLYYMINEYSVDTGILHNECVYKMFFKKTPCNPEDLVLNETGGTREIVLKFWNIKKGSVAIQFYDFTSLKPVWEPNVIKTRKSMLEEGHDPAYIVQKKITFIR